jgi:alpha-galactosidase
MKWLVLIQVMALMLSCRPNTTVVWLDELDLAILAEDIRPIKPKANYRNEPIQSGDSVFERGIGVITFSAISMMLDGNANEFSALVFPDRDGNPDIPVRFYLVGDRKVLFDSGLMLPGDPPRLIKADIRGIRQLGLLVTDTVGGVGNKRTYANWADARLTMAEGHTPRAIDNTSEKYVLTPPPKDQPRINSPLVFGVTPGNPFLYTIAASGKRPMEYTAQGLPEGLFIDSLSGIISGKIDKRGAYKITLNAKNTWGEDTKELVVKAGDTISLTPPMGWNGWNAWASSLDRSKVMASARAMKEMGLADYGWSYVNIDDTWQGERGGPFNAIQPNQKFPDFQQMIDSVHVMGLKMGLYSTPYMASYAGYPGASSGFEQGGETHQYIMADHNAFKKIGPYRFESNDAAQMAAWGVDFLKYDWRIDLESARRMSSALRKSGRDIVLSLSNSAPFALAQEWVRVANMYRTGPDIRDSWLSLFVLNFGIDQWGPYGGPGHWNDPDMMVVGNISTRADIHPTRLTPDEQYSHVSIYSLLAAPMLIGCPVEQMDDFTLSLLTNAEVIEINQDPLGKPARLVGQENGFQVWLRPLSDGSFAVGIFNLDGYGKTPESYFRWGDEQPRQFELIFDLFNLPERLRLRDTWRQEDLGVFSEKFITTIPYHGVRLLRLCPMD